MGTASKMKPDYTKRPFLRRLDDVLRRGNLTVTELARWLERPDSTVRTWMVTGRLRGPPGDVLRTMNSLRSLERKIDAGRWFPVPVGMSRADRRAHIEDVKRSTG